MAEIGLGTVQFGMNYGISNKGGKTSTLDASKLLQVARDNHIDVLDTASAYGTSESALGKILKEQHRFKVVTNITQLNLVDNADDLLADGGFFKYLLHLK